MVELAGGGGWLLWRPDRRRSKGKASGEEAGRRWLPLKGLEVRSSGWLRVTKQERKGLVCGQLGFEDERKNRVKAALENWFGAGRRKMNGGCLEKKMRGEA